ncbi:hypothetical protein AAFF_G00145140, partial [Aldrovandia affinis]
TLVSLCLYSRQLLAKYVSASSLQRICLANLFNTSGENESDDDTAPPPACTSPSPAASRVGRLGSSGRSMFVLCYIKGEQVDALIVTGSTIRLIRKDVLPQVTDWAHTSTRHETVMGQTANMMGCKKQFLQLGRK